MTPADAPTVFVIDDVAAVREPIQGRDAAMDSIIGPILYRLLIRDARVRSDRATGIAIHARSISARGG